MARNRVVIRPFASYLPRVPMPQATICYIDDLTRRTRAEAKVECENSIELTLLVMRACRELNRNGALILHVEFLIDGKARRHYPSGRRGAHWQKKYGLGG